MKKLLHKIKNNRTIRDTILLSIIAFFLAVPMFHSKTDIYLDDGSQHLMRAYYDYKSLLQNGSETVISSFTNGFGYSWNLFYGPLSSDFIMVLGVIFGTFGLGFKMAIWIILFLAGISMYRLVKEMTDQRNIALLAGIIYITSPYFFTDIYVRHAMGECMAFIFIPMVFLGLYNLFNTEKNHYYLILGASGLILSHNISTVLVAIFAIIYCIVNIKNMATTHVKKGLLIDIVFILLITSFFWMPFLQTKFYTNYQVYEPDAMSTQESFLNHALSLKDLLMRQEGNLFVFEIGLPVIIMLVFSLMTFRKLEENRKEYLFFLISGIFSSWMATKYFPWKWLPHSFYIIQLPWRLLLLSSFCFAMIASINMAVLIRKFNEKDVFVLAIICITYIATNYSAIPYAEEVAAVEEFPISSVTGQNNEWLPGMGRLEYLPSKAYQNTFYIATRKNKIIVLEGNCNIQENIKIGTYMTAKIKTQAKQVKLELPFINYPGYSVKLDGMLIETFETENGFLGCYLNQQEEGKLEIQYTGTRLMNVSKIISVLGLIGCLIYVWKKH